MDETPNDDTVTTTDSEDFNGFDVSRDSSSQADQFAEKTCEEVATHQQILKLVSEAMCTGKQINNNIFSEAVCAEQNSDPNRSQRLCAPQTKFVKLRKWQINGAVLKKRSRLDLYW